MARTLTTLLVPICFIFSLTAIAQTNEDEALDLVDHYLALHNTHDLEGVMALYAEDAEFTLSQGRGTVKGRDTIRDLEMFDVVARSNLSPYGLSARWDGGVWQVDLEGVIEASAIFSAAGLPIVLAEPVKNGFSLRDGKIQAIVQPEIRTECVDSIFASFSLLINAAKIGGDPRLALIVDGGRLELTPKSIPIVIDLLNAYVDYSSADLAHRQIACSRLK